MEREKKWRIELTEHQLRLIANCVEDCHRFIGGQMELSNSTACLKIIGNLARNWVRYNPLLLPNLDVEHLMAGMEGIAQINSNASSLLKPTISIVRYTTN